MSYKLTGFKTIDDSSTILFDLSQYLFSNPELAYKETKAHDYLCNLLEAKGFDVERNFVHATGFRATLQTSLTPHFAILVEYDALPGLGHACGHNLIAECSVATALGLKTIMDNGGLCKLSIFGTPAEENGGGKIKFVKEGLFDDADLCIMSHPSQSNMVHLTHLAAIGLTVSYEGKESHASLSPWKGRNALDAAVLAYQSISCLRQQTTPDSRIHGIISNGGEAPNIIPRLSEMKYIVRHSTKHGLVNLLSRIYACFESAAKMTGCTVEIKETVQMYEDMVTNSVLSEIFYRNAVDVGISFNDVDPTRSASSDVGNVSHVCPTIQPCYYIGTDADNHTAEFATCAGTESAHVYTLRQANAMLGLLVDVLEDDTGELMKRIKEEFNGNIK